jgi:hypothetical protein
MADVPVLDDPFAILSEAEQAPTPVRVLKDQDTFAVFDLHGDIVPGPGKQYGMYHAGTRFLSGFELLLAARQPLLLSSTISDDNVVFSADLTNPDVIRDARVVLPRGTLHLFRSRVLQGTTLIERLRVTNHGLGRLAVPITIQLEADFADVFEVRGTRRLARGEPTASMMAEEHAGAIEPDAGPDRGAIAVLPRRARAARLRGDGAHGHVRGQRARRVRPALRQCGGGTAAGSVRPAGHGHQSELRLQPVDAALERRSPDDGDEHAARTLPLCGHPVVQHPVRS